MTGSEFAIIWVCCLATMLACRCIPIFVLKGRALSPGVTRALNLIPPAAFASLVANDLIGPAMFQAGVWQGLVPLIASLAVIFVARKTNSLIWCAAVGVASYAFLSLI